ncbi:MAG: radical SAM protein, partial [Desulfobacterales bacterium]|nr:radical SAM protein [Desulfobacterales bacterium]
DHLKNLGYGRIFVTDSYANFDKARFKAILSACADKKIGLHFVNGLGLRHLDKETVCLLKHTVQSISLSPESLLDPELTRLKKPFDRQTALEKIRMAKALGLPAHLHFILGLPGQSREEVNRSLTEIWRLYRQSPFIPRIQQYRSRQDLFISQNRQENIYPAFSPRHSRDPWLRTAHGCFDAKVNARGRQKIIINVSYRCNNRCRFCAVADRQRRDGDFFQQKNLILDAYKQGIRRLDIDGGEPFLYDRLFDLLDTARHYTAVTITTNGRMLAYKKLAQRLSDYPNLGVLISLHGPNETIHDRETNSPGSFRQTVQGIANAAKTVSSIGINTTVTRHNYHSLPGIAGMVQNLGIKVFNIQWYAPFGNVDPSLVPPDDALTIIRDLIATCNGAMEINMINFLYCQAPDLFGHMIGDHGKADRKMLFVDGSLVNLSGFLKEKRIITKQCAECEYKIVCNGFWNYGNGRGREPLALLDIIPGYACNRNCVFCALPQNLRSNNPATPEIIRKLEPAVAVYRPERARIGGGEPTIRKDLFRIMGWLKQNGVPHITVQTNGLRLADPEYLGHLIRAGADKINISLPAYDEAALAGLTGVKGSLALIQRAIQDILGRGMDLALDILLTKTAVARLDDMVATLSAMGAGTFNFWFISIEDHIKPRRSRFVPKMSQASEALIRVFNKYEDLSLLAYYIPFCFFPDHLANVWHPADENAFVVTPEKSFFLEQGRIDRGVKTKRCAGCRYADTCFGIRENYLEVFGDSEIHPI